MAFTAYTRNMTWKNEYTLWRDVVDKSPNKAMPHVNLGNAFVRRGMLELAEREFKLALNSNPRDTRAINGMAVIYLKQKNYDEAIRLFEILATDKPKEAPFHSNLGVAYMKKGMLTKAKEEFEKALQLSPEHRDAKRNLNEVMQLIGKKTAQ